jgi:glycine C-acetyltransferase
MQISDHPVFEYVREQITKLKNENAYRELFILDTPQLPESIINNRKVINLSSNNYLGLTTHPKVVKAARDAIDKWGVGTAAVRSIIGTMSLHRQLEKKIAEFKNVEAAIVLQSGFATNVTVMQTIFPTEEGIIISDELNHASIIDGCRLAKCPRRIYKHRDMGHLKQILEETKHIKKKLISSDGVFSMDGDIAPLPDIVELAEKYGAAVMVDDAHSTGVLGKNGHGTVDHYQLHGRIHIQIGTLSKAVGAMGGFVASKQEIYDYFSNRARQFIFSSSHPPSVIAACIAAFEVMDEEPQLNKRLWDNTNYFKGHLNEMGFNTGQSQTPITPIIIGDTAKTMRFSDRLFEEGVFAQAIVYPTVPRGTERVRTIITAAHTKQQLDFALEKIRKVGMELGIVS